ncbi:glutaredoxin family protein [Mesobacillus maritimus]|uniref:Glutaredoxin family protein n=1 Tax=Mesobacillus maritimus TaxID=1643336 RepID=A0ABS7K661_9BACI|nr:glutaredoxin family protein [Mesobacillus maritimus]MBY0097705.1 glutaredoxin family protein [Mesobacillus maritimus]
MTKPTIYTQNDCPPCKIVKMFLNEYKIDFVEKNITQDQKARDELTKVYGAFSTPTVVVNDEVIIGFDLKRLAKALKIED